MSFYITTLQGLKVAKIPLRKYLNTLPTLLQSIKLINGHNYQHIKIWQFHEENELLIIDRYDKKINKTESNKIKTNWRKIISKIKKYGELKFIKYVVIFLTGGEVDLVVYES